MVEVSLARMIGAMLSVVLMVAMVVAVTAQEDLLTPIYALSDLSAEQADLGTWMEMSGQFNDRLLGTVYWCLGTIVGLVVVVVSVNWFTGQRSYDRDRAAMEAILKGQLDSGLAQIRDELLRAEAALRTDQSAFQTALRAELIGSSATRSAELSEKLQSLVGNEVGEVVETVEQNQKIAQSRLEALDRRLSGHLNDHRLKLYELDATSWRPSRDVPSNALRSYIAALEFILEQIPAYSPAFVLANIAEVLPETSFVIASDAAELTGLLNKVGEEHAIVVAKIRSLLANK